MERVWTNMETVSYDIIFFYFVYKVNVIWFSGDGKIGRRWSKNYAIYKSLILFAFKKASEIHNNGNGKTFFLVLL